MAAVEQTEKKLEQLTALLTGARTMLIVMQDNPDPDAIASAAGLRRLANAVGSTRCFIAHAGIVGRSENRELVKHMSLKLHSLTQIPSTGFDLIALVDTQPGTGNNSLPDGLTPQIVIDHHPIRRDTYKALFSDIRSKYGATSTILFEYLSAAGIAINPRLATGLLYGIRSDTQDLGREADAADVRAVLALYPVANKRTLGQIQRGNLSRTYFAALNRGLQRAQVFGPCIATGLGEIDNPDMIAEVADLLLRNHGSSWALCYGVYHGKMLLSLRASNPSALAGKAMRRIVGRKGTGGGHCTMAGGQIPLLTNTESERREIEAMIQIRFTDAVRAGAHSWEDLV